MRRGEYKLFARAEDKLFARTEDKLFARTEDKLFARTEDKLFALVRNSQPAAVDSAPGPLRDDTRPFPPAGVVSAINCQ